MFDPKKLADKLEQLRNPKGFKEKQQQQPDKVSRTWKPKEDEPNYVRFIKYPHSTDEYNISQERWFHYGVAGKHSILCLYKNKLGDNCPVCKLARQLWLSNESGDKEMAKKLFPVQRFFLTLIDRSDPKPTPKFFAHSRKLYDKLITYMMQPDYINCFDELNGLDATITVVKSERNRYPAPDFVFARCESRLAKTDVEIKEILNNVPKLEEVCRPMSEEDVEKIINNWLKVPDDNSKGKTIQGKQEGRNKNDVGKTEEIFSNDDEQSIEEAFSSIK